MSTATTRPRIAGNVTLPFLAAVLACLVMPACQSKAGDEPRLHTVAAPVPSRGVDGGNSQVPSGNAARATPHPLERALRLAKQSLTHLRQEVRDYTAIVVKRERINGNLSDHQFLEAKVRNRRVEGDRLVTPFSVYLRFRKPSSVAEREVIWVEGRNDGKLIAHEGGFKNLLRVKLKPDNMLAMFGQRYPITDIGIENLLVKLIEKGERDLAHGECKVQVFSGAKVSGRVCTLVQVEHPVRRPYFDFYRARIFIDDQHQLPIRYAAWTWPESADGEPVLEEEYTYQKLRLNVGLADQDFDPDNSEYAFP